MTRKARQEPIVVDKQMMIKGSRAAGRLKVLSSTLSYKGPLFNVYSDLVRGPGGHEYVRDVIRHNGSVVVLGIDDSKSKKDPLIILEKQYRHAAGQFLLEIPAGKLEPGEKPLAGAKRELLEETGFTAKKWTKLIRYYASPGFLGESMQIFIAEGLTAGEAKPEIDEFIEIRMVKLSELLALIDAGKILDGKTIVSVLMYSRLLSSKRR
jgi:ADP-ribose pyrophosphatase